MYELLHEFVLRPEPFSRNTVKELWTKPHLAKQMLKFHLAQNSDLASRKINSINHIVELLDLRLALAGKNLCDLGCGPGLYTQRFADLGAKVTGVDFSSHSLNYAISKAEQLKQSIHYINADYLKDELPGGFDVVTLIYGDFCVLSPDQRKSLLKNISTMLVRGGRLVLDASGTGALDQLEETTLIEEQLMAGFWSPNNYIGLKRTLIYPEVSVSLDRYLIIEKNESWEIFNWFQYLTEETLEFELKEAGFSVEEIVPNQDWTPMADDTHFFAAIALKA